jgi:hypothetical protein
MDNPVAYKKSPFRYHQLLNIIIEKASRKLQFCEEKIITTQKNY